MIPLTEASGGINSVRVQKHRNFPLQFTRDLCKACVQEKIGVCVSLVDLALNEKRR